MWVWDGVTNMPLVFPGFIDLQILVCDSGFHRHLLRPNNDKIGAAGPFNLWRPSCPCGSVLAAALGLGFVFVPFKGPWGLGFLWFGSIVVRVKWGRNNYQQQSWRGWWAMLDKKFHNGFHLSRVGKILPVPI